MDREILIDFEVELEHENEHHGKMKTVIKIKEHQSKLTANQIALMDDIFAAMSSDEGDIWLTIAGRRVSSRVVSIKRLRTPVVTVKWPTVGLGDRP